MKNFYFDVLHDIANKYINTVHKTIKMETIDFTSGSHAEYNKGFNEKYPKIKAGDRVRISKYKKIFAKGYTANYSEDFFVISKIKNTVLWSYGIRVLNGEEITKMFYEKE